MPVAALLLCLCYMQSFAPHHGLLVPNKANEMDRLISALMVHVVHELNKTGIDYTNLTNEYNKLCPSRLNQCRNCSCDVACWERQQCCPNCPHAFLKRGCVNIAVMGNLVDVMMIDQCPFFFEGDVEQKNLCSSNTSEIAPVSYMELDFKNRYCAECHVIYDYEQWEVEVTCQKPIPDYLKLDKTLEETLSNSGCEAALRHPYSTYYRRVPCDQVSHSSQIDRCNVTGLWKEYDKGLSWACKTLDSLPRHGVFKNVYCYLCNPSLASTTERTQVNSCISNRSCSSESGFSERLSPYRSVCMLECNDIGRILKLDATVDDNVTVTTNEIVNHATGQSKVEIQLLVSDTDDILTTVKPFLVSIYGEYFYDWTAKRSEGDIPEQMVNGTWLEEQIRTYSAVCGDQLMCNKPKLSDTTSSNDRIPYTEVQSYYIDCAIFGGHNTCHTLDLSNLRSYDCSINSTIQAHSLYLESINPVCGDFCSCLPDCLHYNNCCADLLLQKRPFSCFGESNFPVFYPSEMDDSLLIDKNQADDTYTNTFSVVSGCLDESSIFLNMCTSPGIDNNTDLLSHIPVTTGEVLYKNIYCLLCNQGQRTFNTVMNIELECNTFLEESLFPDLHSILSVARTYCKTTFKPKMLRLCRNKKIILADQFYATGRANISFSNKDIQVISKCNQTGMWTENSYPIRELCEADSASSMYLPEYRVNLKMYKNFACFECNPDVSLPKDDDRNIIARCEGNQTEGNSSLLGLCLHKPTHARWFPYKNFFCAQCNQPPLIKFQIGLSAYCGAVPTLTYTYRNLFSLGSGKPILNPPGDIVCAGIYDTDQKKCRVLQCGKERKLVNNTCLKQGVQNSTGQRSVTSFSDSAYQLRFRVTPDDGKTVTYMDKVSLDTLCSDLLNSLWENFYPLSYSCKVYNSSCETMNIAVEHLSDLVLSYIVYNISGEKDEPFKDVVPTLVDSLSGLYTIESNSGQAISLKASPVTKGYDLPSNISTCTFDEMYGKLNVTVYVNKFLNCPHVRFEASAVDVDTKRGSITLHHDGSTFEEEDYQLSNGSFIICKQDYNSSRRRETTSVNTSTFMRAYTIFNKICILLSLVCLLFTYVTFSIFKTLKTIPGKNIMTLTLTIFIAQLLILIAPIIHTNVLSCAVLGVAIHYFWLAMFSAMCVCSFHMFRLFYIGYLSKPNQDNISSNIVVKYNTFVFGFPFLVITLVIICHLSTTYGLFIGYTRNNLEMCFLGGFYPILFGFIIPVLLLNVASMILFSMSFHKIRTSPRMRGKEDRRNVIIYIKLCTLVGITWPLQMVDAAFDMSVLSFIAVCFNAFQGMFIFCSYICNARVLRLYKKLIDRKPPSLTPSDNFSSRPTTISTDDV